MEGLSKCSQNGISEVKNVICIDHSVYIIIYLYSLGSFNFTGAHGLS